MSTPTKLSEEEREAIITRQVERYDFYDRLQLKPLPHHAMADIDALLLENSRQRESLSAKDAELELIQAACEHAEALAKDYEERSERQAKRIKVLEEALGPFAKLGREIQAKHNYAITKHTHASDFRRAAKALEGEK